MHQIFELDPAIWKKMGIIGIWREKKSYFPLSFNVNCLIVLGDSEVLLEFRKNAKETIE